jgi:mRNA-degrading endonuclease RelE of RelBE toxin-antitoxin system
MSASKNRYTIKFQNTRIYEGWLQLSNEFPDQVNTYLEFLKNNPEDRLKAVGLLKKLKGKYKGILQYDITKKDARVWYVVDKKHRFVTIKYAGHHPDKY